MQIGYIQEVVMGMLELLIQCAYVLSKKNKIIQCAYVMFHC